MGVVIAWTCDECGKGFIQRPSVKSGEFDDDLRWGPLNWQLGSLGTTKVWCPKCAKKKFDEYNVRHPDTVWVA